MREIFWLSECLMTSSLYVLNVGLTSHLFLSSRCPKAYSNYSKLLHEKMDLITKLNFFFYTVTKPTSIQSSVVAFHARVDLSLSVWWLQWFLDWVFFPHKFQVCVLIVCLFFCLYRCLYSLEINGFILIPKSSNVVFQLVYIKSPDRIAKCLSVPKLCTIQMWLCFFSLCSDFSR